MSITVIVDMKVKPEAVQAHADRLKVALPETKSAEGCIELIAHQDTEDPTHFMVYERWTSRQHYEAYLEWRKSIGSLEAMAQRLQEPLKLIYLNPVAST